MRVISCGERRVAMICSMFTPGTQFAVFAHSAIVVGDQ